MQQHFRIFKNHTSGDTTAKYWHECMKEGRVHIVITTKRKYARIEYDFHSYGGDFRKIDDLTTCNISPKIQEYAFKYADEHHLPSAYRPKVIGDVAGGFEFYIEDVEKVGNDISKIITDIVESGCIKLTTLEEMIETLDPEMKEALLGMYGENK